MKLFKLYCSIYDSHQYWLYTHPNPDRTKEEFESDMKFLLVKYGKEYLQNEDSWAGSRGWMEFISEKFSEFGYEKIEPMSIGFSSGLILDESDQEFRKIVGMELWQDAMEHNRRIRKEMDDALDEFEKQNKLNSELK